MINDRLIAAGSSPSTVSIIDIAAGKRLTAVNLTMDIRNAIHGLECWPANWGNSDAIASGGKKRAPKRPFF